MPSNAGAKYPINFQQLKEIYEIDPEITLKKLSPTFLKTTPPLLESIQISIEQQDTEKVTQIAHHLYGNAAAVGADQMQALTERIESLASAGEWAEIDDWLPAFVYESERVMSALQERV